MNSHGHIIGATRRPIQSAGLARGPERAAEIGVSGSVNPQFWGALASLVPVAASAISKLIR